MTTFSALFALLLLFLGLSDVRLECSMDRALYSLLTQSNNSHKLILLFTDPTAYAHFDFKRKSQQVTQYQHIA